MLYITQDGIAPSSFRQKALINPAHPFYPYPEYAVTKEVGLFPYGYFGKILMIVPDYRARIRLVLSSGYQIKVKLDTKENLENFICKYYSVTGGGIHQNDLTFNESEEVVEFKDEIREFHIILLTKEGEAIDYKSYPVSYYVEPGVEIEYTPENIEFIIKGGENEQVEFKREIGEASEFAESVVAFANKRGGTIFIGVDDHCNIVGANQKDLDKDRILSIIRDNCEPVIEPYIRIHEIRDRRVVIINIPEGKDKPYLVKNKGPYIRVGGSDRVAIRAELDQLYKK